MKVSANAVRATCYWLLAMNRYMWFATMNRNEPSSMNRAPGCDPCNELNWFERFIAIKSYISHVLGSSWAPSDQSLYWLLFCVIPNPGRLLPRPLSPAALLPQQDLVSKSCSCLTNHDPITILPWA